MPLAAARDVDEQRSPGVRLDPQDLVQLLCCELCPPGSLFQTPTTLACGHTVCSGHLVHDDVSVSCPVPDCLPLSTNAYNPSFKLSLAQMMPGATNPTTSNVRLAQIASLVHDASLKPSRRHPRRARSLVPAAEPTGRSTIGKAAKLELARGGSPHEIADEGHTSSEEGSDQGEEEDPFSKTLLDLVTCEICLNRMEEPVTAPCQHTFCLLCLQRSLDHVPNCPLCRCQFPNVSIFYLYRPNLVLSSILTYIDSTVASTSTTPTQDFEAQLDTAIFVCQLSFPGLPTILHIFEPRYRLMLRRAIKSPPDRPAQFGMIMYPAQEGQIISYGTMLTIQSVRILADGRSVIETWGSHRFRILDRGDRDGYVVGKVERIDDLPEAMERELERNAILFIPPRTPPPQTFPGLTLPTTPNPTETPSVPPISQPPLQHRRSSSPSPSLVSIATVSSAQSLPSSSAASSTPSQARPSRRTLTRTHAARRVRPGANRGSEERIDVEYEYESEDTTHPQGGNGSGSGSGPGSGSGTPRAGSALPGFDYPSEMSTEELVATCHAFIQRLRRGSSQIVIQRLNHVGPIPEDKRLLSFWIAQLLPVDELEKAKLLPIRSPRLRLRLVVHWIEQFNAAWWFSGCVIA